MAFQKYNYINTIDKIIELDQYLMDGDRCRFSYTAVDTETNGLSLYLTTIVGFSISVDSKQGFYIPLLEWVRDEKSVKRKTVNKQKYDIFEKGFFQSPWTGHIYLDEFITPDKVVVPDFIAPILKRWLSGTNIIMHNAPFDINHIYSNFQVDLVDSLFLDTALLSHILNENSPNGLKETANEWKEELGINPYAMANEEQKELGYSVLINGGDVTQKGKATSVWRADPVLMNKYACADTFLTFGLFEIGLKKFISKFGEEKLDWLFYEEIMPLCKEVVIPMKRKGVYIDVPFFKKVVKETAFKLLELEDKIIEEITPLLGDFELGKSMEKSVSNQRLIKRIIELEGLKAPMKLDPKTGIEKLTLGKPTVKKLYQEDPHWLWGYILGEDEIKYSEAKLNRIKAELYHEVEGRRYRFNLGSDAHLRWVFCKKLGMNPATLPQIDSATKEKPVPSMKADVLEEHMLSKFPWVRNLLLLKRLKKLQNSYFEPAVDLNIHGWLYMDMRQNGTTSGRFACSGGFNLQTLPRIDDEMDLLAGCNKQINPEDPKIICGSKDVTITKQIEALSTRRCNKCGYEQDIIIASAVKTGFIAPPGFKIVNADYSSLEPRCFAFVSGDDKLKEVYWKGLDLYSKVYCDVFDKEKQYSAHPDDANFLKKVNKSARTFVKPIVLGIPYGARAPQVANLCDLYKEDFKDGKKVKYLDVARGQEIIDQYLGTYQELSKYMLKQEVECVTKGFVESLCGRRRHFKNAPTIFRFLSLKGLTCDSLVEYGTGKLKSKNVIIYDREFTENELRILIKDLGISWESCEKGEYWKYIKYLLKADLNNAKNFPIQSLAGHIANRGMLDTTRLFKQRKIDGWVCLQIHDEIMTYVKTEQSQEGLDNLKIGMEDNIYAKKIDIAMIADPVICDNIKDAK